MTQTLVISNSSTVITTTIPPNLYYALTVTCGNKTYVKRNVALLIFSTDHMNVPCKPKEGDLEIVMTYLLFYNKGGTRSITFSAATWKGRVELNGTLTVTLPSANVTLGKLATMYVRKVKVVLAFFGAPAPPIAAVGAVAIAGGFKKRSRPRPSPRRAS